MTEATITALDAFMGEHQVPIKDLTWRPAAYGIVIEDGKLLLSRQFKTKFNLPGGGVDLGENLEAAVIREVKEETGIDVEVGKLAGIKTSIFFDSHSSGKAFHSILLYYVCKKAGGELSTDGFDDDEKTYAEMAEWVPIDTLDSIDIAGTADYKDIIRGCF